MQNTTVVKGKIERLYNNCPKPDGWFGCFFKIDGTNDTIPMTGKTDVHVRNGMSLRVTCIETTKNGKLELNALDVERLISGKNAIVKYLSGPDFKGIGLSAATKVYDTFGSKSLDVIEHNTDWLKQCNLSDKQIQILYKGVMDRSVGGKLRKAFPILVQKPKLIKELGEVYGDKAVQVLQKRPYATIYECEHMTFEIADDIALQSGIPAHDKSRILEGLQYVICNMFKNIGHVYVNVSDYNTRYGIVCETIKKLKNTVSAGLVENAFRDIYVMPMVALIQDGSNYLLYTKDLYYAEKNTAELISKLTNSKSICNASLADITNYMDEYEDKSGMQLDMDQRIAVVKLLGNRLSIIKGGPGCGKTTVVECALYCFTKISNKEPILAAPTGRAARRLTESTSSSKLFSYKAETIMRQLVLADSGASSNKRFRQRFKNTLIVIDECSMIGLMTASKMLDLYKGSQIVLVGDVNQLPSIETGQFFRDLCESGKVPMTELSVCYRAQGGKVLIENAKKINDGVMLEDLDMLPNNFEFHEFSYDSVQYQDFIVATYLNYLKSGLDISEICALSPTHNGLAGVNELNGVLQDKINPIDVNANPYDCGYEIKNSYYRINKDKFTRFRVGDRVIQTENVNDAEYRIFDSKGKCIGVATGLYNGDCGVILKYTLDDENYATVRMDDGRVFEILDSDLDALELAYAMTVHKSQGCEYSAVIFSAQPSLIYEWFILNNFTTRNLFYTAVTRAKRYVSIIGSKESVNKCIEIPVRKRNSKLQDYII